MHSPQVLFKVYFLTTFFGLRFFCLLRQMILHAKVKLIKKFTNILYLIKFGLYYHNEHTSKAI